LDLRRATRGKHGCPREASLTLPAERCQNLVGKRLVEVSTHANPPLQPPRLAGLDSKPDKLRHGPATLRDDDLFSLGDSLEKTREVGLGVVNVEDSDIISLASLVYPLDPGLSSEEPVLDPRDSYTGRAVRIIRNEH
jgi:hypothetical protein